MPAEGMVHALEMLHGLLKPEGCLIDLHPDGQSPPIELVCSGRRFLAGHLQETDDFIEYAQAEAALAEAVQRGWFELEQRHTFEFFSRSSSMAEFRDFIEQTWSDAIISPEIDRKVSELRLFLEAQGLAQDYDLEMKEIIRIVRMRKKDV